MNLKKYSLVLAFLTLALTGQAQTVEKVGQAGKIIYRNFKVGHNTVVGLEALRTVRPLGAASSISAIPNFPATVPNQSFRVSLPQITQKIEQATLPGYFYDFPTQFREYAAAAQISVEYWNTWLGRDLDQTGSFQGHFVKDFSMVVELLDVPVIEGVRAIDAVGEAFAESRLGDGKGFFVLAQEGNAFAPKDVFILDMLHGRWISLKASRGKAISSKYRNLRQTMWETNLAQEEVLAKRGVIVRVDNPTSPKELEVSKDGVLWDRYSMTTNTAIKLWRGWKEGAYIFYSKSTGKVQYATGPGKPLFNSFEMFQEANK